MSLSRNNCQPLTSIRFCPLPDIAKFHLTAVRTDRLISASYPKVDLPEWESELQSVIAEVAVVLQAYQHLETT